MTPFAEMVWLVEQNQHVRLTNEKLADLLELSLPAITRLRHQKSPKRVYLLALECCNAVGLEGALRLPDLSADDVSFFLKGRDLTDLARLLGVHLSLLYRLQKPGVKVRRIYTLAFNLIAFSPKKVR